MPPAAKGAEPLWKPLPGSVRDGYYVEKRECAKTPWARERWRLRRMGR